MPAVFSTLFIGHAVKFSHFSDGRLLVATAEEVFKSGKGRLHVLELDFATAALSELTHYDTEKGIYDCSWSWGNGSVAISAVVDGSVKIWNTTLLPSDNPLRSLHEHSDDVHSVDWSPLHRESFLSASSDHSVKLWSAISPTSVRTFREHADSVYAAVWSPLTADVFASASGDSTVRVWDDREPGSTLVLPAHGNEVLSCDSFLATASVDGLVRVWDIRAPREPAGSHAIHCAGVRRVRFSPHREGILVSSSYDKNVCVWNYRDGVLHRYGHHTGCVIGVDMSVLVEGLTASIGWDDLVYVWRTNSGGGAFGISNDMCKPSTTINQEE